MSSSPSVAQTRVEFHLLPATSTGPLDPVYSPDGQQLAFSMRGDIWRVPAEGGAAVALTQGPDYHFQPAWSPDGRHIATVIEHNANLDIAVIPAAGLEPGARALALTEQPGIDIEPAWSSDGLAIFFAARRGENLDIYRLPLARAASGQLQAVGAPEPVVGGRGHQFSPAPSPDGTELAYLGPGPGPGRLGSGVVWVRSLVDPSLPPRLVIDEETSYRAAPRWLPSSTGLVYSTDAAGSNDIAVISARGGQRVRLSEDPLDEFAPAVSPDGEHIVFVSNHDGPPRLYRMSSSGGARSAWTPIIVSSLEPNRDEARLSVSIIGPGGSETPARAMVSAADGRAYAEHGAFLRRFWINDTHYFHSDGSFDVDLPVGRAELVVTRGFEYRPARATVDVGPGQPESIVVRLERLIDMPARGWFSGDTHTHDLHEGRWGLTQQAFFDQARAEDLHVTNALIHMDGTKLMGRWSDLTGEPYLGSDEDYILFYSQEFRGSFGHVALLGLQRFVTPLIGGVPGSPYSDDVLKLRYLDEVRDQGGIGGFVHPYNGPTDTAERAASADIAVHVALGRGEFYDLISIASLEWPTLAMYYRFLNSGFRLAATGGTDNFSDAFRDPSPGTARTYAYLPDGLSFSGWLDAVRQARTFATSGPLLDFRVAGRRPGSTIRASSDSEHELPFTLEVASIVPLEAVELVVNGEVIERFEAPGHERAWRFTGGVAVPAGGWVAARAYGPSHPLIGDAFPFAHTSPVWVERGGTTWRSATDVQFLIDTVDALWRNVGRRDRFATEESREAYRRGIEQARRALAELLDR